MTHNIAEAVFLSERILVMSPRPGRIVADVRVPFAMPRTAELRSQAEFARLTGEVSRTAAEGRRHEAPCAARFARSVLPPVAFFVTWSSPGKSPRRLWDVPAYLVPGPDRVLGSAVRTCRRPGGRRRG